jgi:hypothetical protein
MSDMFEAYIKKVLVLEFRPNKKVVMDKALAPKSSNKNINLFLNINFHKSDKIKELIENASCEILALSI